MGVAYRDRIVANENSLQQRSRRAKRKLAALKRERRGLYPQHVGAVIFSVLIQVDPSPRPHPEGTMFFSERA